MDYLSISNIVGGIGKYLGEGGEDISLIFLTNIVTSINHT